MSISHSTPRELLSTEFAQVYAAERCRWAPENPRRVFNLAFICIYPKVQDRLSPEEFLEVIYETLRGADDRPGLFETYDPSKYHGPLSVENHFVNFFRQKLLGRLTMAVRRPLTRVRPRDRGRFPHRPELGLHRREARTPAADRGSKDDVRDVLSFLDRVEQVVVHLLYWEDLSERKAGLLLGMDHKAVGRVHKEALRKLRGWYGVEEKLAES